MMPSTSTFRLFGDLYLPLSEKHINDAKLAALCTLIPQLRRFEAASTWEYVGLTGPAAKTDDDIRRAFAQFQKREVESWLPIQKSEEELVAASGSIESKVTLHLNHPSFTTNHAINGEVCDSTNPCLELVIAKGFSKHNAFWLDHFSRRERKSDAMKDYGPATKIVHEEWSEYLRLCSRAKVEVVWGRANFKRLTQKLDLSVLPLWGPFEGVEVHLEWMRVPVDTAEK
jgi:hypothetical protein